MAPISAPTATTAVGDLLDALAERSGAWVLVEQRGTVLGHGVGAGPCPPPLAASLVAKSTQPVRDALIWRRGRADLDGDQVDLHDLGGCAQAWVVGPCRSVPIGDLIAHLAAAILSMDGVVTDPVMEDLLLPRPLGRRSSTAPVAVLTVLRPAPGFPVMRLARLVAAAAPTARVHATEDLVIAAGADPVKFARLANVAYAGSATVPEGAPDWIATAELAIAASEAAQELGLVLGDAADVAVASLLLVRRAARAAAELAAILPTGPLQRLIDYDRRTSGDMVSTMSQWCRAGFDVVVAAKRLHVHPNTMRYRLRRIEEVGGVDLSSPNQLLALQLQLSH